MKFACVVQHTKTNRFHPASFEARKCSNGSFETSQGKIVCKRISYHSEGVLRHAEAMQILQTAYPDALVLSNGVTWYGESPVPEILWLDSQVDVQLVEQQLVSALGN